MPSIHKLLQGIHDTLQTQAAGGGAGPARGISAAVAEALRATTSDLDHERVIVRYTKGNGRRRMGPDGVFITLQMWMFDLDLQPDGYHEGVWQALFQNPNELEAVPPEPAPPLNQPVGPVVQLRPLAATKAHWTFRDDSRLYAEGPALSHFVRLGNGHANFSVACSQILTEGGTGWFQGAHGLKQSLGATHLDAGVDFFDPNGPGDFTATTIDTFRIVWPNGVPKNCPF